MTRYKNLSGNSGIRTYELTEDGIIIEFKKGGIYLYNDYRPGATHVARMTELAVRGTGLGTYIKLGTYINKYVRDNYAAKLG